MSTSPVYGVDISTRKVGGIKQIMTRWFLMASFLFFSACSPTHQTASIDMATLTCPEVRPEMCTMDYDPVCGRLSDGSFKTFSNACNACTDQQVYSYYPGECK
jgi:hypothetical protein